MTPLRRFLRAVIGDLRWTPPPWLATLGRPLVGAAALRRSDPRRFWTRTLLVVLIAGGGAGTAWWIATRPTPDYLTVTIATPEPTSLEPGATPNTLHVVFSGPAAPIEQVGKEQSAGFTVTPPIAGTWW